MRSKKYWLTNELMTSFSSQVGIEKILVSNDQNPFNNIYPLNSCFCMVSKVIDNSFKNSNLHNTVLYHSITVLKLNRNKNQALLPSLMNIENPISLFHYMHTLAGHQPTENSNHLKSEYRYSSWYGWNLVNPSDM